jgi:hypothetical protein
MVIVLIVIDTVTIGDNDGADDDPEEDYDTMIARWSESGLRTGEGAEKYATFLAIFGRCFVVESSSGTGGGRKGGGSGRTHYELLSEYMPEPLEAFAVTIYTNNYQKFLKQHWKSDSSDLSSVSDETSGGGSGLSLFTSDSRGAGKYAGWSEDGKVFYNRMYDVIEKQRSGGGRKDFEEMVRRKVQQANQGGKKRKCMGVTVRNGISKLRRLVGSTE